jgi:outer membrane murein-binding lipoprotein Lpp
VNPEGKSALERHAQTVIGAMVLALLLWAGSTLLDVRDRVVRIETQSVANGSKMDQLERQYHSLERRVHELELADARYGRKTP